jgi:flagellin
MGLRINTNVSALSAQRSLGKTTQSLNKALSRLASGERIVRAGDDAAGLAISEGLRSQIRGMRQAVRNANDANGFLQTAEGALGEMTNIAQRLRELAVQAANGSLGPQDRGYLDGERVELVAEFNRIANSTTFNTTKLLDGTFSTVDLQVGVQKGETISFTIGDARSTALGKLALISGSQNRLSAVVADLQFGSGTSSTAIEISGDEDGFSNFGAEFSALAITTAINGKSGESGVFADNLGTTVAINDIYDEELPSQLGAGDFVINGVDIVGATGSSVQGLVDAVNQFASTTGVVARIVTGSEDDIELVAADGRNIDIAIGALGSANFSLAASGGGTINAAFRASTNVDTAGTGNLLWTTGVATNTASGQFSLVGGAAAGLEASASGLFTGAIELRSKDNIIISGTNTENALGFSETVKIPEDETALAFIDLSTQEGAQEALANIDAALQQLTGLRSNLGAIQNRLQAVVNSVNITNENLSSAQAEIRDADLAIEVADLTRAQILQQAGVAVLGQANASAQVALSLLQF